MKLKQETGLSIITLLILLLFVVVGAIGQSIPPMPNPPRLVNDFAKILTPQERSALEQKLVRFNDTTSNQITVVTINSLDGYTPSQYAFEIGHKWKVGQKKFDNGIVILVKQKLGSQDRGVAYIAVGYGLEPAIPDAIAKRIVDNEMIPYFKQNDYYKGINKATTVLMKFASGEISAGGYGRKSDTSGIFSILPFLIIIIIVVLIRVSGTRSQGIRSGASGTSFWTALWLGSALGGGSNSGSWNSFSGGSSGFGGGGGGFGGFGGGGFGGGGAGGSW